MDPYKTTLQKVTDMFESCGCHTKITTPSPHQVTLIIEGPTAFCPPSILEEHLAEAREAMRLSHPETTFHIDIQETT